MRRTEKSIKHKLNHQIKGEKIRITGNNLEKYNLVSGEQGRQNIQDIADEHGVDLIMTSMGDIPICKLDRYTDFLYKERKRNKQPKSSKVKNKEVKFKIDTSDHDLDRFYKQAVRFTQQGHNVKVTLFLRYRDKKRIDAANLKMLQFIRRLEVDTKIIQMPKLTKNSIFAQISKK